MTERHLVEEHALNAVARSARTPRDSRRGPLYPREMNDEPRRFRLMILLHTLVVGLLIVVLFVNWK